MASCSLRDFIGFFTLARRRLDNDCDTIPD
jgi:hypothetical protein